MRADSSAVSTPSRDAHTRRAAPSAVLHVVCSARQSGAAEAAEVGHGAM